MMKSIDGPGGRVGVDAESGGPSSSTAELLEAQFVDYQFHGPRQPLAQAFGIIAEPLGDLLPAKSLLAERDQLLLEWRKVLRQRG
jgi:hypothetical protein